MLLQMRSLCYTQQLRRDYCKSPLLYGILGLRQRSLFYSYHVSSKMLPHEEDVQQISDRVKSFYNRGEPFRIYHGSTNSTRIISHDRNNVVNISSLSRILSIDTERRTALVEPNVPMDALAAATMEHDLVPPVVPEFPGITVGGSYSGTAGESSSFRHGFFDRIVNWAEIVLANGDVVKASPSENSDLFYGAAGAFGTFGITTLFEIQLTKALEFVEVTYLPVSSPSHAVRTLQECVKQDYDFIDGIMYSLDAGVVVVGRMTSLQNGYRVQKFTRFWDPWFYLHARTKSKTFRRQAGLREKSDKEKPPFDDYKVPNASTELVPLYDYLFRYDRGAFWMGSYAFAPFYMPFNALTRLLADHWIHTRKMYEAMHHSGYAQTFIIQDLILPDMAAESFIRWTDENLGIYPLWLCPIKAETPAGLHRPIPENTPLLINVGLWGPGPGYNKTGDFDRFVRDNRAVEAKVRELEGKKWLYAQTYYTRDEFWSMYDKKAYDQLRNKYNAENLPDIYDKVKRHDTYRRLSATKGVIKMLLGWDPLLARNP